MHNHNHNHGYNKEYRHEDLYKKGAPKPKEGHEDKEEKAIPVTEQETKSDEDLKTQQPEAEKEKIEQIPQIDPKDAKIEELKNQVARLQADFSNLRKHTAQDQERLAVFVTANVAKEFLKVLDNFDRAEASMEQQGNTVEAMHEGMTKIHKQFQQALQMLHIEEIPAQGQKFNPEFHEAVMQNTASELPDETIDLVAEKGYKIGDNIIRHSKVRVVHKG